MQVVTLTPEALREHACRLAAAVAAGGARYDALCGIRRGGALVADAFCLYFPKKRYGLRADMTLQRPSTQKKGKWLGRILRRLPVRVLDLLRIAEAKMLALHRCTSPEPKEIDIDAPLLALVQSGKASRILLIDDAIDSGNTIWQAIRALKEMNPALTVDTAVITQTATSPRMKPDFTLYSNGTLIRFPWSEDYKTK